MKIELKNKVNLLELIIILGLFIFNFLCINLVSKNIYINIFAIGINVILYQIISCKKNGIYQPITIINLLIFVMFVIRPIALLNLKFSEIIQTSNSLRVYSLLNNINSILSFPHVKVLHILLIGTFFINLGYNFVIKKNSRDKVKLFSYEEVKINWKVFLIPFILTFISIIYFFMNYNYKTLISSAGKLALSGIEFSTLDILWAYLFPFVITFNLINNLSKKKNILFSLILTIIYILLVMSISRRYFVVNLFILLVTVYFYKLDKPKFSMKYIIIICLMLSVVLIFANIRNNNIGKVANENIILQLLDEFDMYDMLICSQNEIDNGKLDYYGGENYLSFPFIPRSIWEDKPTYFDIENTQNILKGHIKGGIPTSIIGSLYLNFSIFGATALCFVFGCIIAYLYNRIFPIKNIKYVIIYGIYLTFIYDIFRVGDITRELWTAIVYILSYLFCYYLMYGWEEKRWRKN